MQGSFSRRALRTIPRNLKGKSVSVGFPKENGATNSTTQGVTALEKAIKNNFGLGVPKRPFMSIAFEQNRTKYSQLTLRALRDINTLDVNNLFERLGIIAVGDIQNAILNLQNPPNSQYTIEQKGSSNPLIDTGHMRQSVTYKVEE